MTPVFVRVTCPTCVGVYETTLDRDSLDLHRGITPVPQHLAERDSDPEVRWWCGRPDQVGPIHAVRFPDPAPTPAP
jgi:hypothetical protein